MEVFILIDLHTFFNYIIRGCLKQPFLLTTICINSFYSILKRYKFKMIQLIYNSNIDILCKDLNTIIVFCIYHDSRYSRFTAHDSRNYTLFQISLYRLNDLHKFFRGKFYFRLRQIHISCIDSWYQMNMCMRHLQSNCQNIYPVTSKRLLN